MAVESPLQGMGEGIFSIQRQLRICGDANHCRSPLGVRNVLRLVVLWEGGGLNRFPTNIKDGNWWTKKKTEGTEMLLTLKETMKPPLVHSSTIGFKIFGTWSISIDKLPFPDCILCSDYISSLQIKKQNLNTRKEENFTIFCLGKKKSLTAAAR